MEADGELSAPAWWSSALSALAWWSSAPPWCAPVPSAPFLWAPVLSGSSLVVFCPVLVVSAPPWWAPVPFASPWWLLVCLRHPGGLQFVGSCSAGSALVLAPGSAFGPPATPLPHGLALRPSPLRSTALWIV